MSVKKFQDLEVGAVFNYDSLEYIKINLEKVSCCRSVNASQVTDPTKRTMVKPDQEVSVDE